MDLVRLDLFDERGPVIFLSLWDSNTEENH